MSGLQRFTHEGKLLAILLRATHAPKGVEFYSDKDDVFQMGAQEREAGFVIQPHVHKPLQRTITGTPEMIHLDSGRMKVFLYDNERNFLESVVMEAGDTILFLDGGHGFRFLERGKFVEVKQGPYAGMDADKEKFEDPRIGADDATG